MNAPTRSQHNKSGGDMTKQQAKRELVNYYKNKISNRNLKEIVIFLTYDEALECFIRSRSHGR